MHNLIQQLKRLPKTIATILCRHQWKTSNPDQNLNLWSRQKQGNDLLFPNTRFCPRCNTSQVYHSGINNMLGKWVDLIAPIDKETACAKAARLYAEELATARKLGRIVQDPLNAPADATETQPA